MVKNNLKNNLLFNTIGLLLFLVGTSLFYTGVKGLLIEYVSSNPQTQFLLGCGLLVIAYKMFDKKIKY